MKFINEDGDIVDGQPLTDEQLEQREQIRKFIHEKVCRGAYHSKYGARSDRHCEAVANFFATNFTLQPIRGFDLNTAISEVEAENSPVPEPVAVAAAPRSDDMPF